MTHIKIEDLGLIYEGKWVFEHLSLSVKEHEFVSILGPRKKKKNRPL